jgi:uncharacterized protein DUF5655/uncharacterized protein DUF4287
MATPAEAAATMKANLKQKTGKSLAQWAKLAKASKLEKHGQIVKMLKSDHGLTHGYANLIAHEALQSSAEHAGQTDLVEQQYAGKKEALRPIYEALLKAVAKLGADVEVSPKKSYVSLRRGKQFALIQPSTATRVDLGLCLKGTPATGRLEASGSFNSMCSHRVRLASARDVNAELRGWLKKAYSAS